jgi:hypothetical protein
LSSSRLHNRHLKALIEATTAQTAALEKMSTNLAAQSAAIDRLASAVWTVGSLDGKPARKRLCVLSVPSGTLLSDNYGLDEPLEI